MFESRQRKIIEIFNGLTLLAVTYFMCIFSELTESPHDRYYNGRVYIGLIVFNVGVQLIVINVN